MSAPAIIQTLVTRFRESRELYRSGRYNETQLRNEFLNPFFEALGWDMYNRSNYAPQYREVIHEDSLEIEADGSTKAPDYAFRLGTARKFFVEAKKPKVNIRYEIEPAYQLRRYAWNAHLPLSILTDFEELAVYDCRTRPDPKDSAATGRVMLFTYEEYLTRWDELAQIFSREAVWNGSFDRYAEGTKGKRGTTEVDTEFLKEIEQWRFHLARNIALRNFRPTSLSTPSLEVGRGVNVTPSEEGELKGVSNPHRAERQLNYAVQTTIDRILFLRICEDRKIEPTDQLLQIAEGTDIYTHLLALFQKADQKYNSGLFHFKEEKSQTSAPDTFTPNLRIDDKVLRQIIKSTYYPCPYMFNEIPVEILGQVYEQFLGSVIRLTPGGQAKVEEKPEVRKAGGVYYTPRYIVDYIVQNTLGRLLSTPSDTLSTPSLLPGVPLAGEGELKGVTPTQALTLRIVDPACGSGSFLLGAYQYLLDWHLNYYLTHDPAAHTRGKNPPLVAAEGGEYRLTTETKKQILTSSIFGVDIDAQAVEVTKLSLLLKLLEGETGQLALGFERVLPDLGNNIRCGNSLIGWDYFEGQMFPDEEEIHRVNPFDWKRAFPHVFAEGGFDAVIGNPPYIRQESLGDDKRYYQNIYKVFTGTADIYSYFIEKGVNLLAPGGQFSFIVANKWLRAKYGFKLRQWLKARSIEEITDFGDLPVFTGATTYPLILRVSNNPPHFQPKVTTVDTLDFVSLQEYVDHHGETADQTAFEEDGWSLAGKQTQNLLAKIRQNSVPLGEYVNKKVFYGIKTGLNKAFVIDQATKYRLIAEDPRSAELIKPFAQGRDVKRYAPIPVNQYLIFTRRGVKINNYPAIKAYLNQFKDQLMPKPANWKGPWKGRKPGNYAWYEIQDTIDYHEEFSKPKIVYPNICKQPEFTFDETGIYTNQKCFIIPTDDLYLLGILNSSVSMFLFTQMFPKLRGDFYEPSWVFFQNFPIPVVNFSDQFSVARHDQLVALVKNMLQLKNTEPLVPQDKRRKEETLIALNAQIDRLVFEMYGVDENERRIVAWC